MTDHNERGGYGCLTASDSGLPQTTDEPGKAAQCSCGKWWHVCEIGGFVVWQPMTDADKALHLPGEIGNTNPDGTPMSRHAPPGDVCMGCSDPHVGRWVPLSQCMIRARSVNAEARRRQRENLDALIASASRAVRVALAEAEDLYLPDHETAEALRAAQNLVALSKRWNVGPS